MTPLFSNMVILPSKLVAPRKKRKKSSGKRVGLVISYQLPTNHWISLINKLPIYVRNVLAYGQVHQAHSCVFIAVPSIDSARGNAGMQILDERESVNPAKQMAVRRTHKKAIDAKKKATLPKVIETLTAGTSTILPLMVTQHHPHQRRRHPAVRGWRGWNQSQSSSWRARGQCSSITLISSRCRTMQSMRWKGQHPGMPEKKSFLAAMDCCCIRLQKSEAWIQ